MFTYRDGILFLSDCVCLFVLAQPAVHAGSAVPQAQSTNIQVSCTNHVSLNMHISTYCLPVQTFSPRQPVFLVTESSRLPQLLAHSCPEHNSHGKYQ